MLLEKTFFGKKNSGLCIGVDLNDRITQISYAVGGDLLPETVPVVPGSELYNIPTVLCKRNGISQWFYGREALRQSADRPGTLVENLVSLAKKGEPIRMEGEEYDPVDLLVLFLQRSFSLLPPDVGLESAVAMLISVPGLDSEMVNVLHRCMEQLPVKNCQIYYQDQRESFYEFVIHQEAVLMSQQVLMCEMNQGNLILRFLDVNHSLTPKAVTLEEEPYHIAEMSDEDRDLYLYHLLKNAIGNRMISSVYLVGDDFQGEWMRESLRLICYNRRVFLGNNLYSKGACYGAQERAGLLSENKKYLFLGEDKVKIKMFLQVKGGRGPELVTLLQPGGNWYETASELDLMANGPETLHFLLEMLSSDGETREETMELVDMPEGSRIGSRIRLTVNMETENSLKVKAVHMGLGEFFPATGKTWEKEIVLW